MAAGGRRLESTHDIAPRALVDPPSAAATVPGPAPSPPTHPHYPHPTPPPQHTAFMALTLLSEVNSVARLAGKLLAMSGAASASAARAAALLAAADRITLVAFRWGGPGAVASPTNCQGGRPGHGYVWRHACLP